MLETAVPIPPLEISKPSPPLDLRRQQLEINYLCASNSEAAKETLSRLETDRLREVMGGMNPEERARAAAVDELKERMPGLIRTGAVVSLSWVVGERLAEHFPNMRLALGAGGTGLFASGAAVETTYKLMHSRETTHPKVAVMAMSLATLRPFARLAMEIGAGISGGVITRGVLDGFQAAAQQAGAGGELPPRSDWTEETRAQGWPSAEQRFQAGGGAEEVRAQDWQQLSGQPPGEEPPVVLSPQAGELVDRAGEVAAQDAQEMADAAQGAAEMAARQAALEAATRVVEVQPNDNLTTLVARAGGDPYGADFTNTVLQSADVLTGPQNPNRDMARALIEFIKAHPGGVNWRDAINGVGSLAKEVVGGVPLKDAIAQATRMVYPGQEMKVVVGAGVP